MAERGETLGAFSNPTVLMTRPRRDSERFVDELRKVAGPFRPVIAPAFEIERTNAPVPPYDCAIFTSRAGVEAAPLGDGSVAYCVGDATAKSAKYRGYNALSAKGDVEDLIRLILAQTDVGSLVHLRGEKSRGNVSERLKQAGIICEDVVLYRKAAQQVDDQIAGQIKTESHLLIPSFSAETVSILADWNIVRHNATVVAISDQVAKEAKQLNPSEIVVSDRPDLASMTQAVAALIA